MLYQLFIDTQISSLMQENCDSVHQSLLRIFNMCLKNSMSASCRLCAILAADTVGLERGYMLYIKFLLNCISNQHVSSARMSLAIAGSQIYRELLKDCAVFDDPDICGRALFPLMNAVLNLIDHEHGYACLELDDNKTETKYLVKELLKSIGVILSCKGSLIQKMLQCINTRMTFNHYVIRLSEAFGQKGIWLDGRMSNLEQNQITSCLQKLGILSFFDEDCVENEDIERKEGFWLYDDMYSVRAAHLRMGPKVASSLKIFSDTHEPDEQPMVKKRKIRSREDSISEEPLMEYINCDLLGVIFSFLSYKTLSRATLVCKSWRAVGNQNFLWNLHYERRFKPIFLENLLSSSVSPAIKNAFKAKHSRLEDVNWKHVFIQNKNRERPLMFKLSCGGWRHRYCRVFECRVILRKKNDEEKHMNVHKRDVLKKLAVVERAEERRRTKLEKQRKSKET